MESQAIKRAHRIGQTRPISGMLLSNLQMTYIETSAVKTLAIRKTAEEHMVLRRELLKGNQGRLPDMLQEVGMKHFIEVRILA